MINDQFNGKRIVRVRGLPFQATENDVRGFFSNYGIEEVKWSRTTEGRHNGMCHVVFVDAATASQALSKNRQYIGQRYVELFLEDFSDMERGLNRGENTNRWLKLRGAAFTATAEDLSHFFDGLNITLPQVTLIYKQGRPSGEAIAHFSSDSECTIGMQKNRQHLGSRYIELIPIDDAEAELLQTRSSNNQGRSQFVTLRGLPYRANIDDIAKFFEGIEVSGIYIRYDKLNRPSGEAFAELKSSAAVDLALGRNRNVMGGRYIEVFRTEREEVVRKLSRDDPVGRGPPSGFGYGGPHMGFQVNIDAAALAAAAAAGQQYITIQVPTQSGPQASISPPPMRKGGMLPKHEPISAVININENNISNFTHRHYNGRGEMDPFHRRGKRY